MEIIHERCCSSTQRALNESHFQFKPLELRDFTLIQSFIQQQDSQSCDYSVGTLMMWRCYYQFAFIILDKTLIIKSTYEDKTSFMLPIGPHLAEGLAWIEQYCDTEDIAMRFNFVSDREITIIRKYYPNAHVKHLEGWYDYVYDYQQLLALKGKKFQKLRNHINRFNHDYPQHHVECLQASNLEQTISFYKEKIQRTSDDLVFVEEQKRALELLAAWPAIKMKGLVLFVEDEIVGFTIGELNQQTLFVHVEKTNHDYAGANQKLFHSFLCAQANDGILWINREEDMGDEGLRQSKTAWRPIQLLEKYELIAK